VVAVGPSDVLETVNAAATVYDKTTGTKLDEFDFAAFFGTTSCGDPRALYLAAANRFAFACTDFSTSTSPMRFAISETADPAGAWYHYQAPNASFLDQEKIEATADKFIIAGNTSSTENIYVFNLSDVLAGVANPKVVTKIAKKSNVYQAVVEQTSSPTGYFVSSYPGGSLFIATVNGTPAAGNVTLSETLVSTKDYPAPIEPIVPGGKIGGGNLDGRVYDAIYEVETSDGKPVIQYSSARLCGTRDCITSARIDLSGVKPLLSYDDLIGEPGFDYTYGAVGLDAAGDVFEVYQKSSATTTPSMAVVGPGFDVKVQSAAPGTTACTSGATPPCDEHWGDYLGTAIDPSSPTSVWVSGLYQAQSGGYGWGSYIAKVSTNAFTLPAVTSGAATNIKATSATVTGTVNPGGVPTTYHVDYGLNTGYDSATAETSAGSGTSPVPLSVPLTALTPGTTYHYRVVATTAAGSAVSPDRTFHTRAPSVSNVAFTGTPSNPTVTITGTNFGPEPPPNPPTPVNCVSGDTSFDYGATGLSFEDVTGVWTAGQTGDCIGLVVSSYSNTKIVYSFGPFYTNFRPVTTGDSYEITIWGRNATGTVAYT
jgi:hypothetical protein